MSDNDPNDGRSNRRYSDPTGGTERRTFLKTGAVLTAGSLVTGTAIASPEPPGHEVHVGESAALEGGCLETYATTDSAGNLSSIGVHIDGDAFAAFDEGGALREEEVPEHLQFPTETDEGNPIDLHQFTFMGFHYNPEGHAPPGIYTVPHFDFHFYTIDEEVVEGIAGGPLEDTPLPFVGLAEYEVPEARFPPGYVFEEHRLIVDEMGEHLLDGTAPEFHGEEFTHTYVYGVYDPTIDPDDPDGSEVIELEGDEVEVPRYEGDGESRIHFVEPMITTAFIREELEGEETIGVATPTAFFEADDYPTTYAIEPDGDGGVYVSVEDFEPFPGAG